MADVTGLYARFGVHLPGFADGWASTRCFAGGHRDRHPSARVHLRSGGFRCFTCGAAGGALDALQLLGVRDRDEARRLAVEYGVLDPPPVRRRTRPPLPGLHRGPAPTPAKPEPVSAAAELGGRVDYDHLPAGPAVVRDRAWVYVDEHGTPAGRVHRLDLADGTKRIWQERPDPDGWKPGLDGAHLPLYRLPLVLEHARQGGRVIVVEGEKAVDALDRVGFFATTCPGGAGKWRDEHTASLAGATVFAIADCDLPGRLHALQLSLRLAAAGVNVVEPLDLDPNRDDGYDVVDHLAAVADTVRAVTPNVDDTELRVSLHQHLRRLIGHRLPVDAAALQEQLELAAYRANPDGRAYLACKRCGRGRVHSLAAGLAYCPCGAHQKAPE